jgi:hypothetical protein
MNNKKEKMNLEKSIPRRITISEIISLVLSGIAIVISSLTFILPLFSGRLVFEEPANIYMVKSDDSYDELIIPVICNNYGSYIRTINKMECTLQYKNELIPMKPVYEYENVFESNNQLPRSFYSSYIVGQNNIETKYISFKFNSSNFTKKERIPSEFHFQKYETYVFNVRFYTTRNRFNKADREIIQVTYAFDTKDNFLIKSKYIPSNQVFFKINDSNTFPAYQ